MVSLRIAATGRLAGDAFLISPEPRSNNAVGAIIERVTPHCGLGQGPGKALRESRLRGAGQSPLYPAAKRGHESLAVASASSARIRHRKAGGREPLRLPTSSSKDRSVGSNGSGATAR